MQLSINVMQCEAAVHKKQTIRMTNQGALRRRCTVLISVVATLHFREWVWWKEER